MQEELTVAMEQPEAAAIPAEQPAVDAQEDVISLAQVLDLPEAAETDASANAENAADGAPAGSADAGGPQGQLVQTIASQKDFDAALGRRLEQERAKYAPAVEMTDLVMQATGAKDPEEARKILRETFAERRANQMGTTTEQEIARIADQERIARLERSIAPPSSTPAPDPFIQDIMTRTKNVVAVTGDAGFEQELLRHGSRISQRILAGEPVETVWREERGGATAPHAASPSSGVYARQAQQPPLQVETRAGGSANYDVTKLTDEQVMAIDEQLKRGVRVRMP